MPVHSTATHNGQIEEFSCLLTDEQQNKMWLIQVMQYYSAI